MSTTTRERLLSEAERLIRRLGYAGFSYGDLSKAVGLTKASIHHHFPSKEGLGLALVAAYDARYAAAMAQILVRRSDGPARIRDYGTLYLQGLTDDLGCLCAALAIEVSALPPSFRTALAAFFDKHVAWLADVVAEGRRDGSIRAGGDPRAEARRIVATLEGALLMGRVTERPADFSSVLSSLEDSLRA